MSDAILCDDLHLRRKVVIKSLKAGIPASRILDELAALQAVRSKHVVQIYDVICNPGGEIAAIVQEYIPGDDLTKLPAPTSAEELLKILYPIAEGIHDIHVHGRIHRDIKRQNMKYDAEDCLKIFDFGLARDDTSASTLGERGTPGYMAPELFVKVVGSVGKAVTFTPAVDVFAFAVTALAIVYGKIPPDLKKAPPVLPSAAADFAKLPFNLPDEVAEALNRCLAKNPSDRPTMEELTRIFALHLLRDKHRALLVGGGGTYVLDSSRKVVQLGAKELGSVHLNYDGLRFVVTFVSGAVAINNIRASVGFILPGSCVIVLGAPEIGSSRVSITVDVSHPEVVI